ncbi:DUF6199 family natural product biosynthesis protein [Ktedonobacter sp. SOSP1-85]|uniref:DUF6199 family natural product biosynthesis protein n=1 Tax=Ktedonobacter sp. SOSP1-85 TaxID=2778367 RepID=UPI0035B48A55
MKHPPLIVAVIISVFLVPFGLYCIFNPYRAATFRRGNWRPQDDVEPSEAAQWGARISGIFCLLLAVGFTLLSLMQ